MLALRRQGATVLALYGTSNQDHDAREGMFVGNIPFLSGFRFARRLKSTVARTIPIRHFDAVVAFGAGTMAGEVFGAIRSISPGTLCAYYAMDTMVSEWNRANSGSAAPRPLVALRYRILSQFERSLCRNAHLVLCSSLDTMSSLKRYYHVDSSRLQLLYEGVPVQHQYCAKAVARRRLRFIHVSGDYLRKGTDIFLESVRFLRDHYGEEPEAVVTRSDKTVRMHAAKLGLHILFRNPFDAMGMQELYSSSIALVSPSRSEGFCLPVIEAGSVGTPTIASTRGSLPELIKNRRTGLLVPTLAPYDFANAMLALKRDTKLWEYLSANVQQLAKQFRIENVADRLIQVASSWKEN